MWLEHYYHFPIKLNMLIAPIKYHKSQIFLKLHLSRVLSSSIFLKNFSSLGTLLSTSNSKDFMSATLPLMYDVVSLISPSVIVNSAF